MLACVPYLSEATAAGPGPVHGGWVVVDGHDLRYVEAGVAGPPLVVFVYGTRGSWHAFQDFLVNPQFTARQPGRA